MPSKTMKLFAVTNITKANQFSKRSRVNGTSLAWGEKPYFTELVQARSVEEVIEILDNEAETEFMEDTRFLISELAKEPTVYLRGGVEHDVAKA